jgi:TRAP-type C4-dicarboxylate transport system permease small subunit
MHRPATTADTLVPGSAPEASVIDASGHFHAEDAPIELSSYTVEDWIAFVLFWALAANVFYQFYTRYVLNDSAAWTEELARYLLISTVFIGVSGAVRRTRHIHVDFLYRLVPPWLGRGLSTLVDLLKAAFFGYATVLTWQMMEKMSNYRMTLIDLPMNVIYAVCLAGFGFSALRSVQVLMENWRRGYSALERPEIAVDEMVESHEQVTR